MNNSETSQAPWFCPKCRRTGDESPSSGLCAHCGTRVEAQGYCPVCESFMPTPVGRLCPKHDLELEDGPPPSPYSEDLGPWVAVGRFLDASDCQPQCIRLEAEGIPTVLDGARMGSRSMYQVATGGVTLRVPKSLESEARIILDQTWSRDAAELGIEDDDWDDLDSDEPETVRTFGMSKRTLRIGVFTYLLGPSVVVVVVAFVLWFLGVVIR